MNKRHTSLQVEITEEMEISCSSSYWIGMSLPIADSSNALAKKIDGVMMTAYIQDEASRSSLSTLKHQYNTTYHLLRPPLSTFANYPSTRVKKSPKSLNSRSKQIFILGNLNVL
jgi:hypothetical protein